MEGDPPVTVQRHRYARAWDVFLVVAGVIVAYLTTDPAAKAVLADLGGWATLGIGLANILINRLPPLLKALPPVEPPR
jgi:hypothetical protein